MGSPQWYSATDIVVDDNYSYFSEQQTVDAAFDVAETNPTGGSLRGYRGCWWTFISYRNVSSGYGLWVENLTENSVVFLDLFADPLFYPSIDHIQQTINRAGVSISDLHGLADLLPLPFPLRHSKVLGHAILIAGTKPDRPNTNS